MCKFRAPRLKSGKMRRGAPGGVGLFGVGPSAGLGWFRAARGCFFAFGGPLRGFCPFVGLRAVSGVWVSRGLSWRVVNVESWIRKRKDRLGVLGHCFRVGCLWELNVD